MLLWGVTGKTSPLTPWPSRQAVRRKPAAAQTNASHAQGISLLTRPAACWALGAAVFTQRGGSRPLAKKEFVTWGRKGPRDSRQPLLTHWGKQKTSRCSPRLSPGSGATSHWLHRRLYIVKNNQQVLGSGARSRSQTSAQAQSIILLRRSAQKHRCCPPDPGKQLRGERREESSSEGASATELAARWKRITSPSMSRGQASSQGWQARASWDGRNEEARSGLARWEAADDGVCSIPPAQTLLAGSGCYTGFSAQGRKHLGICSLQGKRPLFLTIPRGQQGVQGALRGTGGWATWRHGCTHSDDVQPPSSRDGRMWANRFCQRFLWWWFFSDLPTLTCSPLLLPTQLLTPHQHTGSMRNGIVGLHPLSPGRSVLSLLMVLPPPSTCPSSAGEPLPSKAERGKVTSYAEELCSILLKKTHGTEHRIWRGEGARARPTAQELQANTKSCVYQQYLSSEAVWMEKT